MTVKRIVAGVMAIAWLAIVPAAFGYSPGSAYGFAGTYVARDCATWWEELPGGFHEVNCAIWGDDSLMTLTIGRGKLPNVSLTDTSATFCTNRGYGAQFRAVGYGKFWDQNNLEVTLTAAWCGPVPVGPVGTFALAGPDPTLWDDPDGDGWGTVWYPTN